MVFRARSRADEHFFSPVTPATEICPELSVQLGFFQRLCVDDCVLYRGRATHKTKQNTLNTGARNVYFCGLGTKKVVNGLFIYNLSKNEEKTCPFVRMRLEAARCRL